MVFRAWLLSSFSKPFFSCFRSLVMQMMQVFWTADNANDASCLERRFKAKAYFLQRFLAPFLSGLLPSPPSPYILTIFFLSFALPSLPLLSQVMVFPNFSIVFGLWGCFWAFVATREEST